MQALQLLWLVKRQISSRDEAILISEEIKSVALAFMSYACLKALVSMQASQTVKKSVKYENFKLL